MYTNNYLPIILIFKKLNNIVFVLFQDGIVDPIDSTLRDFCGQCIREFLKWSIKQTTPQQQEKSPVNTKSLFKRLYSLALHPNAFKRLGASLAFNNIYREFRCVSQVLDTSVKDTFETLRGVSGMVGHACNPSTLGG